MMRAIVIEGEADAATIAAIRAVLERSTGAVRIVASAAPAPVAPPLNPTFRDVLKRVSFETGVSVPTILGPLRVKAAVRARTAAVWAASELLGRNQSAIGRQMDRDSTTIGEAVRRGQRWIATDPAFVMLTKKLRDHFEGGVA